MARIVHAPASSQWSVHGTSLVIFGVPGALFVAAASGWSDGCRWAPGVAVLAVIVTIALACVILVGRFGLAGVPGAG